MCNGKRIETDGQARAELLDMAHKMVSLCSREDVDEDALDWVGQELKRVTARVGDYLYAGKAEAVTDGITWPPGYEYTEEDGLAGWRRTEPPLESWVAMDPRGDMTWESSRRLAWEDYVRQRGYSRP